MYKHSILLGMTCLLATACVVEDETGISTQQISEDACPPNVPASIAPAADQDLAFVLGATGVQRYACNAAGTGWRFIAPVADLFQNGHPTVRGIHYAGPTWEWEDGSTFVGVRLAGATVDATAIPWLLIGAASHGPVVGRMTEVTAIQRLLTTGGLAPAGGCTPGSTADVPYTSDYFFYRTKDIAKNTRCGAL